MTNFERIKSMTSKEFAAFINQIRCSCFVERTCTNCPLYDGMNTYCNSNLEPWLNNEED